MDINQEIAQQINSIITDKLGANKYMVTWNTSLRYFKYSTKQNNYYAVTNKERIKSLLSDLKLSEKQLIALARKQLNSQSKKVIGKSIKKSDETVIKKSNRKTFSYQELIGTFDEKEHTDNPDEALKIAHDHLKNHPDYYTQLQNHGLYRDGGKPGVTYLEALKALKEIEHFMPKIQQQTLSSVMRDESEEHEFFRNLVLELADRIRKMPKTYETDGQGDKAIAYLHYFTGNSDWYITEKDIEKEQLQAFGLAVLNGDTEMSEIGYIPIEEIKDFKKGITFTQLDLYWTPKSIAEIKKGNFEAEDKIKIVDTDAFLPSKEFLESKFKENIPIEITKTNEYQNLYKRYLNSEISGDELYEFALKIHIPVKKDIIDHAILIWSENYPYENVKVETSQQLNDIYEEIFEKFKEEASSFEYSKSKLTLYFNDGTELELRVDTNRTSEGNDYYPPRDGKVEDYISKQKLGSKKQLVFAKDENKNYIEPVNTDDIITSKYINQYLYNKAVEKLLTYKTDNFTKEEKDFISHFSGFGGLRKEAEKAGESFKDKFLYEYFTPEKIAEIMVRLAKKHGYKSGGSVLEPSCGIGVFLKFFKQGTPITTYEVNPVQHLIAKILYPWANHINAAFETVFLGGIKGRSSLRGNISGLVKYDLVIGNPPYGAYGNVLAGYGEQDYSHAENYIDYFIFRGLDVTKSGGLLIFVVGAEPASGGKLFTDKGMYKTKQLIKEKADLIDAVKLWQGAFARTDVMTEILVFRKK